MPAGGVVNGAMFSPTRPYRAETRSFTERAQRKGPTGGWVGDWRPSARRLSPSKSGTGTDDAGASPSGTVRHDRTRGIAQ